MWEPQVDLLERFHVVRPDLRGFGDSPPAREPFSYVDDVRELLGERTTVVGASLGGRVALELALSEPERVERLVLADSGLRDWEWSEEIRRYGDAEDALLEAGDVDGTVELNLRMWLSADVDPDVRARVGEMQRRALELYLAAPQPDLEEPFDPPASSRLGEVSCPTLVVVGALDHADFHAIADRLVAEMPNARKAVVPGAAHLPSLERPDDFNHLLREFLD